MDNFKISLLSELAEGPYSKKTIQFLIVTKGPRKEFGNFLALAKDKSGEISICVPVELYDRVKISYVYQLTGFSISLSKKVYYCRRTLFLNTKSYRLIEVPSQQIKLEYMGLPKEIRGIHYVTTSHEYSNLPDKTIVSLKCQLVNIRINYDKYDKPYFFMTVQIEETHCNVMIKHLKKLDHLANVQNITIKRVQTYYGKGSDSCLLCTTMFTEIFESENNALTPNLMQMKELPIKQILQNLEPNKCLKKTIKVLYMRIASFSHTCAKCRYCFSPTRNPNRYEDEKKFCNKCSYPIDTFLYTMILELTVVDLSDQKEEEPFLLRLEDNLASKILHNTANNINECLLNNDHDTLMNYLKNKVINNHYECLIKFPYQKQEKGFVLKQFYCTQIEMVKENALEDYKSAPDFIMIDDLNKSDPEKTFQCPELSLQTLSEETPINIAPVGLDFNMLNPAPITSKDLQSILQSNNNRNPENAKTIEQQRQEAVSKQAAIQIQEKVENELPTTTASARDIPSISRNSSRTSSVGSNYDDNGSPIYKRSSSDESNDEDKTPPPEVKTAHKRKHKSDNGKKIKSTKYSKGQKKIK